jgi:NTE family protein
VDKKIGVVIDGSNMLVYWRNMEMARKIDAVFEGGGVKGSALVGAIAATEELGYQFENIAGTSAGAIVGALLAAGYSSREIKALMDGIDFNNFKDPTGFSKFPLGGIGMSLLFKKGIYKGDYLEKWLEQLLAQKNVRTFKDLVIAQYAQDPQYRYKLQVIASDISDGKLLVLPRDSKNYGIDPDNLKVAFAVRMSMSIPYFFVPIIEKNNGKKSYIVDGAVLSNFPVWLLDDNTSNPPWPTIGYKLVDPKEEKPHKIFGPITLFLALFETMMEAHDARYIEDKNFARTVPIPTNGVQTTDFHINLETKNMLYSSGYEAAKKFFTTWNFEEYKKKYRQNKGETRTERIW